jgi:hypothetical protein
MISFLRYSDKAVQELRVQTSRPVLETVPTFRLGDFDIYAGQNVSHSEFPPPNSSFCLLISLRSTAFGYATLRHAFSLVSRFSNSCLVSVVDSPYCWNALAQPQAPSRSEAIIEIERLSSEVWRRIENVTKEFPRLNFIKQKWSDLSASTPQWIKDEFENAFSLNGEFADCIKTATQSVFETKSSITDLNIAARFLVEELPVLCWLYYVHSTQHIDLYPGQPFMFFRTLESGGFKTELPCISHLAAGARKFIHVDIRRSKRS